MCKLRIVLTFVTDYPPIPSIIHSTLLIIQTYARPSIPIILYATIPKAVNFKYVKYNKIDLNEKIEW